MNILEIKGIKCSSRSFQIVIEIKQMMKMEKVDMFAKCLIKPSSQTNAQYCTKYTSIRRTNT